MDKISRRQLLAGAGAVLAANRRSKEELIEALRGVHNFMITPFRANYELDSEGLQKNVAYHAAASPKGMTIVVGGGLGELFTLDLDEQRELARAAVAGAARRMPVVVGAGGGYRLALRMAANAEKAGADAVLLFAPPYGSESAEGAYRYFRDVADSVSIGIILYPRGQDDYWPSVIRRLAELPNVVGFKDASGGTRVGQSLGELIPNRFLWVAEGETHAVEALPSGARAYTTALAAFVPRACGDFLQAGVAADAVRMKEILKERIDPVLRVRNLRPGYGISGIKVGLEALGRAGGPVRPPGTPVAAGDRPRIAEVARRHSEPQA